MPPSSIAMYVATTDTVPGRATSDVLGVVLGAVACPRNKFEAGMKSLEDEPPADRSRALMRVRRAAMREMIANAASLGANAIIGMRFVDREVSTAWMEICAYGTAVIVER